MYIYLCFRLRDITNKIENVLVLIRLAFKKYEINAWKFVSLLIIPL